MYLKKFKTVMIMVTNIIAIMVGLGDVFRVRVRGWV